MPSQLDFEHLRTTIEDSLDRGDVDGALAAVRPVARAIAAEYGAEFRELINRIPEAAWHSDAAIASALGASYRAAGSPRGGAPLGYFRAADAALESAPPSQDPERVAVWLGHAAALRTQGRLSDAAALADRTIALADASEVSSVRVRVELDARAALERGMIDVQLGALDAAGTRFEYASGFDDDALTPAERIECLGGIALIDYTRAELSSASAHVRDARELAVGTTLLASGFAAPALSAEMLVAIERHELTLAADLEPQLAEAASGNEWEPFAYVVAAYLRSVQGAAIEALDRLQLARQAERAWEPLAFGHEAGELLRATILIGLDHGDESWSILSALDPQEHHVLCPPRIVSQLRFAHGDLVGASEALYPCEKLGDDHSARTLMDVRMLRAAIEYERGDFTVSDVMADRAFVTMARTGSRAPLRGLPARTLVGLCERADTRPHGTAVRGIIADVLNRAGELGPSIEPLSHRERLVLAEVQRGLTVSAIASELYISPNTVKTHLRRLYSKLGVATRADAIRKAYSLGLDRRREPEITRDSPAARRRRPSAK